MPRRPTDRQRRFAWHLAGIEAGGSLDDSGPPCRSAAEAVRRAGYRTRWPNKLAYRLRRSKAVEAELERLADALMRGDDCPAPSAVEV